MSHELAIERLIDAPVQAVWRAFTDDLGEWWCPRPWTAEIVARELRPGGRSATVMRGPGGEEMPQGGVYLEVVPERRVVFTDAFAAGWMPHGPFMVGFLEWTPEGDRTRYRAGARHWSAEARDRHAAMGFEAGRSAVAAQCEEVARRLAGPTTE